MTRNGDGSAGESSAGYEFGEYRLDTRRLGLTRAGQPVSVEPKAFDVLRCLIERRDRLVGKDELLEAVWKDTFVTPNALTRAVAQLRKVLGDDPERPWAIETVARRGYRFIAPVREIATDAPPPAMAEPPAPAEKTSREYFPDAPRRKIFPVSFFVVVGLALIVSAIVWWGTRAPAPAAPASQIAIAPITSHGDVIDAAISPDGRYVTYVRSALGLQSLWIRQSGGANPIEIVPAANVGYFGVSFAADSASIYYVLRAPEPIAAPGGMLFQIPALGGTPRRLGAIFDHHPSVSPDGTKLASLSASFNGAGRSAVVIASADAHDLRAVFAPKPPDYVAPGFFVAPSFSPSGQELAFAIRNTQSHDARLAIANVTTGAIREFDRRYANATFTEWLRDGSGIVFIAADRPAPLTSDSGSQIWFQPLPGGTPRALTAGPVSYRKVSATADATRLVTVGSMHNGALWSVPLDGGAPRKLPSLKQDGYAGVEWLGTDRLTFTSIDSGTSQIWVARADGSDRRQITADGWNFWPTPTADATRIFFLSVRDGRSGIWRMNADGTDQRLVTPVGKIDELELTPDDRTLLFRASFNGMDSTWKVSVDGGNPVLLAAGLTGARVSEDGRKVAGLLQRSTSETPIVAVFPIDGGAPLATFPGSFVVDGPGGVWWTREGEALLITTSERANLWRQSLRGGAPTRVTQFSDGVIVNGALSPDFGTMVAFRGDLVRDAFMVTGFK